MSNFRKTALLKAHPRQDWGGTYGDSGTWASLFKSYKPYDFGVMGAQTFSSQLGSNIVNKPLMWLTQAQGNCMYLPGGHNQYQWKLTTDSHTRTTIVAVDPSLPAQPGKAGDTFNIYLSRNWYHEPVLLKTEGINQPLMKIIGYPVETQPNVFRYTVKIQDGDPLAFVDPSYLQVGKTVCDASTQISDELNTKYGGIGFGSQYNLQSHIGYVGRKIEVTDKFIRLEKSAREKGVAPTQGYNFMGKTLHDGVGTGYVIAQRNRDGKLVDEAVEQGAFISTAEAMLEERIAMDKEMGMMFGRIQIDTDADSGRQIMTGAGWLQIARDGHYREHNGNLTLSDFTANLDALYFNAVDPSDRKVVIRTGEDGIKFASQLIAAEAGASPFIFDSSYFIDGVSASYTDKALKWGAQFTQFRGYNGITLEFVHDPTKDNPYYYPELHPDTGRPIESGSFDIYDVGSTEAAPGNAMSRSNICMIMEPEAEEYYNVSNVYDINNGSYKDGTRVSVNSKEAGIYRASSYKLEVWDVSRTMRIERVL